MSEYEKRLEMRKAYRAQWRGRWAQRPHCPYCGAHPTMPLDEHRKCASCIVGTNLRRMRQRGWERAGCHAVMLKHVPGLPFEESPGFEMYGTARNVTWSPGWAVQVASLVAPAWLRKWWLTAAVAEGTPDSAPDLGAAEAILALGGSDKDIRAYLEQRYPRRRVARLKKPAAVASAP